MHPEITMHTHSFSEIVDAQRREDWKKVADLIIDSLCKLKAAGADFAIIPANSVHFAFADIEKRSPLPLLSIVKESAAECAKRGYKKVLTLGVGITMSRGLFGDELKARGIESLVPSEKDQQTLNRIIYDEIVPGNVSKQSEKILIELVRSYASSGADAVLLGCTELPFVITPEISPIPTVDTTRLIAIRALDAALADS